MSADVETLLTLAAAGDLPATTDYLMSLPRPARSDAIEIVQSVLPNPLAIKLNYNWPLYARDSQLPPDGDWDTWLILAGRGFGKTRTGAEWVRDQVESKAAHRIALVARTIPEAQSIMIEGESGIINISPPMEQAHIRTIQAKAHMAHRSARTRLLKPRARPAQRPTIRRRMVRRARLMGIPGTDLGQPLLRTQARTTATLSRHHHPQAHRACAHPDRQPRHFHHTRLHLR